MKAVALSVLLLGVCACQPVATTTSAPAIDELGNATYSGIYEQPVTLSNGRYSGEPFVQGGASRPTVGLVIDFRLTGDLDGDGRDEAVVELWENSGGSGTNNYLAVMAREAVGVVNLATGWLGNRVQLRAGRIIDRTIEVDVLQHGPEDAMCCPTQLATRSLIVDGHELQTVNEQIIGTLPVNTTNQ